MGIEYLIRDDDEPDFMREDLSENENNLEEEIENEVEHMEESESGNIDYSVLEDNKPVKVFLDDGSFMYNYTYNDPVEKKILKDITINDLTKDVMKYYSSFSDTFNKRNNATYLLNILNKYNPGDILEFSHEGKVIPPTQKVLPLIKTEVFDRTGDEYYVIKYKTRRKAFFGSSKLYL